MSQTSSAGRWLREPLLHFAVIGVALFALDAALEGDAPRASELDTPRASGPAERVLVIDDGVRRSLIDAYRHEHGSEPDEATLRARIDDYIDDEILYREGLLRGLDEGDERVRARVATLMAEVIQAEQVIEPASEEALRGYFAAHIDAFAEPARLDFVHVFCGGEGAEARARELLAALVGGASPARMGDVFSGGRHYRGRRIEDLRESFGETFAAALSTAAVEEWTLAESRFGWHVVRIERRTTGSDADFERARTDIAHALELEQRRAGSERGLARLRAAWVIEGDGE